MPLPIIIFDLPSGRQKYTTRTIVCSIAMKLKGEWGLSPEIDSLCSILSINTIVIVIAFSFQPKTLIQEAKYEMWILEIQLVWLSCSTDVEQTSLATEYKKNILLFSPCLRDMWFWPFCVTILKPLQLQFGDMCSPWFSVFPCNASKVPLTNELEYWWPNRTKVFLFA